MLDLIVAACIAAIVALGLRASSTAAWWDARP
jgi:hypothetical protein